jgi:hypothetical protein
MDIVYNPPDLTDAVNGATTHHSLAVRFLCNRDYMFHYLLTLGNRFITPLKHSTLTVLP